MLIPARTVNKTNTLLGLVLQDYVNLGRSKLGNQPVDSLFADYNTLEVSDLTEIQHRELLNSLFAKSKSLLGANVAVTDLERSVKSVVDRYGISEGYYELLAELPEGVLEKEKLTTLGKGELEQKIHERTQDISALNEGLLKKLEEKDLELKTEKTKFKLVIYNTVDGIFALDKERKIVAFNKIMEDMTGYSEVEVLNKPADDFISLSQKDGIKIGSLQYCPLEKLVSAKSVYVAEALVIKGRNNREHTVNVVSNVITENAANVGCVANLHDVTSQKDLENMKLDFVSIAAHELRTPLTSIRGYLSLLVEDAENGAFTEDQKAFIERSYLSANQLFGLIENILNVSRIERGSVQLNKEPTDWIALVDQIVASFVSLAAERRVKLSFVPSDSGIRASVDPIMIGEVLSNLIDNAIRYTNPGGEILVFLELKDNFVITHVKDSGQGIPKESLEHLFTKFFRVSGALEQGSKGTGLGLYISKEIVKLHGGEIWADSEVGKGSTFSFSVPRA